MQSPDAEELERLFHTAAALPPDERAEFLSRVDASGRIREMLDGACDPVWNRSAVELEAQHTASDSRPACPGDMFGPYRIVRRIASGGMGFVYEAVRDDAEFDKRVALKFVHHGIDHPDGVDRFRLERQILARLEHPNIARLLDGGTTDDGIPYLVMEYVVGLPIDRFAAERRLTRQERLALFLHVCDGVQYAHRSLVVHRDLKPANILVTPEGVPKLLDFGIAKLLNGDLAGQTIAALTPEYASPEQILGRPIGTATDVYSLGVLLFVLLAERLPFGTSASHADLVRSICDAEPAWQPRGLIDRDLQSVLAQALHKDAEKRYTSVEQFRTDVCRYLEGRPVLARPGRLMYRAAKFVKRRALPLAGVTAALVAIAAGVASAIVQTHRVERRFGEVRRLAHAVLFDVYDAIKASPGSLPARRLIASNAQQYLDSLASDAAADPALIRDLAESYRRLGDVRGGPYGANLGDTMGALESYRKARALIESEAARHPMDVEVQLELAETSMSLGRVLDREYRADEAAAVLNRAIAVLEALSAHDPSDFRYPERLATAYQYLAEAEQVAGFRERSVDRLQGALKIAQKAVIVQESAGHPSSDEWKISLSSKYFSVGYRLMALAIVSGDRSYATEALDAQLKGQAINRALAEAHPGRPSRLVADGLLSTAESRWQCCGDFARATSDIHEAIDLFERLARADPENVEAQRDLANAFSDLGMVMGDSGHRAEALAANRRSMTILEELADADPASVENSVALDLVRSRVKPPITMTR